MPILLAALSALILSQTSAEINTSKQNLCRNTSTKHANKNIQIFLQLKKFILVQIQCSVEHVIKELRRQITCKVT